MIIQLRYFTFILIICIAFLSCNDLPLRSPNDLGNSAKLNIKNINLSKEKIIARNRFDSIMINVQKLQNTRLNNNTPIYLNEALSIAHELNNDTLRAKIYMELAAYFDSATEYNLMAEYYNKAIEYQKKYNDFYQVSLAINNLAWGYIQANDYKKGIEKCKEGISNLYKIQNTRHMARSASFLYNNLSIALLEINQPDSALKYNQLAYESIPNLKEKELALYSWIFTQFGCIYELKKDKRRAQECFYNAVMVRDSLKIAEASIFAISKYCHFLNGLGKYKEAIYYGRDGINIANMFNFNRYLIDVANELRFSYDKLLNVDSAYHFAKMTLAYKDTVFNTSKSIQLQAFTFNSVLKVNETKYELENAKAKEKIKSEQKLRNIFLTGLILVMLFAGLFLFQRNRISKEKKRSEELLLNILPVETAKELKDKGHSEAKFIDQVTVLFTDFKGFTAMSEKVTPKELLNDLHSCFSEFDLICEKYGIEKIKTIGDAYMAAGGLPIPNSSHANDVVHAALEMAMVVEKGKAKKIENGNPFFEVRIGVHTGPVVAGIVGLKKFQYDIWGDTVNTASRIESSGEVGKVNISQATYDLLKDNTEFCFEKRGKIEAKGKGEIEMYFVNVIS